MVCTVPLFIQTTQPGHNAVGAITILALVSATARKKRRVLCRSGPCCQDYWLTV